MLNDFPGVGPILPKSVFKSVFKEGSCEKNTFEVSSRALRASSLLYMSLVTGLVRVPGPILLSVHMGNFSSVDRDEIEEKQPKWWRKLASFAAVVALWPLVTSVIKLFRILLIWKYIHAKIMPFWPLCCESEAILSERFLPGYPGQSVHMGKFSSRLQRSRSQKPRSRWPGQSVFSYECMRPI